MQWDPPGDEFRAEMLQALFLVTIPGELSRAQRLGHTVGDEGKIHGVCHTGSGVTWVMPSRGSRHDKNVSALL